MFIALTNPFILFKDKIKIKIIPVKSATIMSKFKKFNVTITAIKGNNDKIIFGGFSNIFAVASASFSEVTNPSPFFFNVFSLRFKYQIDPPAITIVAPRPIIGAAAAVVLKRSEERRVGKECRSMESE